LRRNLTRTDKTEHLLPLLEGQFEAML
jgi:hypothetical protein